MTAVNEIPKEPKVQAEMMVQLPAQKGKIVPSQAGIKDSLVSSGGKTLSSSSMGIPSNSDQPEIPAYKDTPPPPPPTEEDTYSSASLMSSVFIAMMEIMELGSEMRFTQDQMRMETMQTSYEQALVTAELKKNSKMNQAFQTLTSALGSATEVVIGSAQIAKTATVDSQAQTKYDDQLKQANEELTKTKEDLNTAVGTIAGDPAAVAALDKLLEDPKIENARNLPGYAEKQGVIDPATDKYRAAKTNVASLENNKSNIISQNVQSIDQKIRLLGDTLKSTTNMMTQATQAGMQMSSAYIEEELATNEAEQQLIQEYLSGQKQATDQARSSIDEIKRQLDQMMQSYTSSVSSRA